MNPTDVKYHKEHTWARVEGTKAVIGITDYAQDELGDIVFIELPQVGAVVTAAQEMAEIESAKATSSVIAPLNGTIMEINTVLEDDPEIINSEPYTTGWIAIVELADNSGSEGLMDADAYNAYIEQES